MSMRSKLESTEFILSRGGTQGSFYPRSQQNMDGTAKPFWNIPVKRQAFPRMHGRIRIQRSISSLLIFFDQPIFPLSRCLPAGGQGRGEGEGGKDAKENIDNIGISNLL